MPNSFLRILITLVLLAGSFAFFEFTETDVRLQDRFYDFQTHRWLVDKEAVGPRLLFYTGPKVIVITGAVILILWLLLPPRWRPQQFHLPWPKRRSWFVLLCLAIVPATIGLMKSRSDIHCPWALTRYGGEVPYIHFFDPLPQGIPPDCGRCFPAGHASGGFALLGLYYLSDRPRHRWLGLAVGMGCGWMMGLYQMFKGAHFLSHTIVTMLVATALVQILACLLRIDPPGKPTTPPAGQA